MDADAPMSLLCVPGPDAENERPDRVLRAQAGLEVSDRFIVRKRTFTQQYSHIYFRRIKRMRDAVAKSARLQWPDVPVIESLLHLTNRNESIIIGCIYKEMKLKPNILEEYSEEASVPRLPTHSKYTDPSDYAVLEDMTGRIILTGNIDLRVIHTGAVLAFRGHTTDDGQFSVKELCWPVMPVQSPIHVEEDKYVVILSGLNIGHASPSATVSMQMMINSVTGFLGDVKEQARQAQIVHTIVAGNIISSKERRRADNAENAPTSYSSRDRTADSVTAILEADEALRDLCEHMPVSVMAGEHDPSNYLLPQQPLSKCMFPLASQMSTFMTVTNPSETVIDGACFLGTSGQSLDDAFKFSPETDRLALLESIFRSRHVAPTAPDTLACYPFVEKDPFIIDDDDCPHVFFCSNQPEYSHRHIDGEEGQRVLLLTIPAFDATKQIVLVNIRTLEPSVMTFNSPASN